MTSIQIVGRRSSLFTRLALIFAEELQVPYTLVPIYDMKAVDPTIYAGNPALKLPILRHGDSLLFGTQNICRALAERATESRCRIVWPEDLRDDSTRNAQELVWHCMSAQVQLVMGTVVGELPADNVFFKKARTGIVNSLHWLDSNIDRLIAMLPQDRHLSTFEASLFCLVEHLSWRQTMVIDEHRHLNEFAKRFAERSSAQRTMYQFDTPPSNENGSSH